MVFVSAMLLPHALLGLCANLSYQLKLPHMNSVSHCVTTMHTLILFSFAIVTAIVKSGDMLSENLGVGGLLEDALKLNNCRGGRTVRICTAFLLARVDFPFDQLIKARTSKSGPRQSCRGLCDSIWGRNLCVGYYHIILILISGLP